MSQMHEIPRSSHRVRAGVRTLLLVPVLAAGLAVAAQPAVAGPSATATQQSQGKAPDVETATPPAHGKSAGVQTGRRPR
jgi:hypothetical protein